MTPRGIRLNNPGNIRQSRDLWQGEADLQADKTFVTFRGPEWGIRAMAKILLRYQAAGFTTVRKIIGRWAPPGENDTQAYVADVARQVGVDPDTVLDLGNAALLARLVKAIIRHENGEQPYSDTLVAQGVQLAANAVRAA